MIGGGKKPPDFALLIGKRLDKKGDGDAPPPGNDGMGEAGAPKGEDGMGQEEVENSAISDFMSAKDPATAKAALKDFLEACYPQLAGDGEPDGDEGTESAA